MSFPSCERCKGACCETILVPEDAIRVDGDWGRARGIRRVACERPWGIKVGWELPARCPELTDEGRCGIYATRPKVCQTFELGSVECLDAIRRRRTPEERKFILGGEK